MELRDGIDFIQSIALSVEDELFLDILYLKKYQLHTPHSTLLYFLHFPGFYDKIP